MSTSIPTLRRDKLPPVKVWLLSGSVFSLPSGMHMIVMEKTFIYQLMAGVRPGCDLNKGGELAQSHLRLVLTNVQ